MNWSSVSEKPTFSISDVIKLVKSLIYYLLYNFIRYSLKVSVFSSLYRASGVFS